MTGRGVITRVLSVAGSDSGGGAGIQADLKAFARCGVHGMSAVTVVTAQSTRGIRLIHAVAPEVIVAQIEAVVEDIGVDAVKVGMLGSRAAVIAVADALAHLPAGVPIVVDPVLAASTGARLMDLDAIDAFGDLVLPLATVLTPNLPEARALVERLGARGRPAVAARPGGETRVTGTAVRIGERRRHWTAGGPGGGGPRRGKSGEPCKGASGGPPDGASGGPRDGASGEPPDGAFDGPPDGASGEPRPGGPDAGLVRALGLLGPQYVVLTGGHRDVMADLYWDGETLIEIPGVRHPSVATHGSGCTHSAVLAAQLGLGRPVLEAARIARELTADAVGRGLSGVGHGEGPVDVLGLTGRSDPGRSDRLP